MTVIRKLYLYLTKVIFMLKPSVKLRRYIFGDVAACRRATYVLCAVQRERECVCVWVLVCVLYSIARWQI